MPVFQYRTSEHQITTTTAVPRDHHPTGPLTDGPSGTEFAYTPGLFVVGVEQNLRSGTR